MPKMMTTKSTPTKRLAEEYLSKKYARIIIPDNGGYTAEILEFPGCFAYGSTPNEAIANLENVAADWIDAAIAQGQHIPEPKHFGAFSGRVVLRLPRGLHQSAARMAERNRTSLNQFFLTAISTAVGADDVYHRMIQAFSFPQTLIVTSIVMNASVAVEPGAVHGSLGSTTMVPVLTALPGNT